MGQLYGAYLTALVALQFNATPKTGKTEDKKQTKENKQTNNNNNKSTHFPYRTRHHTISDLPGKTKQNKQYKTEFQLLSYEKCAGKR